MACKKYKYRLVVCPIRSQKIFPYIKVAVSFWGKTVTLKSVGFSPTNKVKLKC